MKSVYLIIPVILVFCKHSHAVTGLNEPAYYHSTMKSDTSKLTYRKSYWIEIGPGVSSRDMAFNASLNLELEKRLVLSISSENVFSPEPVFVTFFTLGLVPPTYKPGYDISAISLKLGKVVKGKAGLMTFAGGISFLNGIEYSTTTELGKRSGIGAALDLKFIPAWKFIGLSFNPFLNINGMQTFGGISFNLALGQVHYRD